MASDKSQAEGPSSGGHAGWVRWGWLTGTTARLQAGRGHPRRARRLLCAHVRRSHVANADTTTTGGSTPRTMRELLRWAGKGGE